MRCQRHTVELGGHFEMQVADDNLFRSRMRMGVFENLYRLTPFSDDAQPVAGDDVLEWSQH